MLRRRTLTVAAAAAALLVPVQASAHAPGLVFSAFGTATVDGAIQSQEWASAEKLSFTAAAPGGGTVPGELLVMNDASNLYLGVRLATTSPTTAVSFGFDNDHDGLWPEEGDDGLAQGFGVRGSFGDLVNSRRGGCPEGFICGFHDTDLGGTKDGSAVRGVQARGTHIELSHPLDSADDLNDFSVHVGDAVGFWFQATICTTMFDCVR